MNCPKCGQQGKPVRVCSGCGEPFASEDLELLGQLQFLLKAASAWEGVEPQLAPFRAEYDQLLKRLKPVDKTAVAQVTPTTAPVIEQVTQPIPARLEPKPIRDRDVPSDIPGVAPLNVESPVRSQARTEPVTREKQPPPPKEKVPFDEWLLSERNIKLALYGGGFLLFIAGIIFVSINWGRIPGPLKFAITMMITGLTFLGGYLLYLKPAFRIGGVALTALACGFLSLDFAVLQIYVMGPEGLPVDVMWLIASPICLLVYSLIAYKTRHELFTCIAIAALASLATAALVVAGAPIIAFGLASTLLALGLLGLAIWLSDSSLADFVYRPFFFISQGGLPLAILFTLILWIDNFGCRSCSEGSSWMILAVLVLGAVFYSISAYWKQLELFTYAALADLFILLSVSLIILEARLMVAGLVFANLALLLLAGAWLLKGSSQARLVCRPFLLVAQGIMPLCILAALILWNSESNCLVCTLGTPWLALLTLGVGVIFYVFSNLTFKWLAARWSAVALFSLTMVLVLLEIGIDDTFAGLILMVLALLELFAGHWLEQREEMRPGALPFYVLAGCLALLVTAMALADTDALIKVLFGDVLLLGVAAWIFQDYRWVYGAVWLFTLPIYLLINTYVNEVAYQGLLMGLLGLNYVVAGYLLGRRRRELGWPFLTASAVLSLVVIILSWREPWIFSLCTAVIVALYSLIALWLEWPWLLFPALLTLDLFILGVNRAAYRLDTPLEPALAISYAFVGAMLLLGGLALRRRALDIWAWPLYLFGAFNLLMAYGAGLFINMWLALGMSVTMTVFLLSFAWLERDLFVRLNLPPILTYLSSGVIAGGLMFLIYALGGNRALGYWPAYLAGLCAIYVGLSWLLRSERLAAVFGKPFSHAGLVLISLPMLGALIILDPVLGAITYAIAGLIFAAWAVMRKVLVMAYLAAGAFVMVIWAILLAFDVSEILAYVAPLGFGLLGLAWNERRQGRMNTYMIPTMLGLWAIMGTTFVQSLVTSNGSYALLLLFECLLAIAWGIYQRVRCYIQAAVVGLVANAIVQLGPAFFELSGWLQIALPGGLLLALGLIALFKREEIINTRQRASGGWRRFGP